jgi:hypothetical protein
MARLADSEKAIWQYRRTIEALSDRIAELEEQLETAQKERDEWEERYDNLAHKEARGEA